MRLIRFIALASILFAGISQGLTFGQEDTLESDGEYIKRWIGEGKYGVYNGPGWCGLKVRISEVTEKNVSLETTEISHPYYNQVCRGEGEKTVYQCTLNTRQRYDFRCHNEDRSKRVTFVDGSRFIVESRRDSVFEGGRVRGGSLIQEWLFRKKP